jgi:23S rRNA (guanosine2251-2'-O)-methyltransferase
MKLVLVVHSVRSAHNVGSLLRTADGLGIDKVYLTGYTPYPEAAADSRLPHMRQKQARQIHKTALGAENFIPWEHVPNIDDCLAALKSDGFEVAALEQTAVAINLDEYSPGGNLALVIGNEISGLDDSVLKESDYQVQIPMKGRKESLNVVIAAAIALYRLTNLR